MTSSDQTCMFPHTSAKGNRYVIVVDDSNTGPILATGIKSKKKEHLITGFITMHETLKKAGINPIIHRIDNEFLKDLIEEIEARGLKYQIVTFKNYFESILFGCDPGYSKN